MTENDSFISTHRIKKLILLAGLAAFCYLGFVPGTAIYAPLSWPPPEGHKLFSRDNREYCGRAMQFEEKHTFPDGSPGKAILLRKPGGVGQQWIRWETATTSYFLRSDPDGI